MHQETIRRNDQRSRLDTKFREKLRNVEPSYAVIDHLKDMWRTQPTPTLENMDTIGSVVSNIYSDEEDYLIVTETAYILVGRNASVNYGEFDGYSSGNKSRKQIVDGLTRIGNYTIYRIIPQYDKSKHSKPVVTLLQVDHVDIVKRMVYSKEYGFHMDEIDLDRDSNTFVIKELFFDGLQYTTKHGTFVKNIIPRKVTTVNASNSTALEVNSGSIPEVDNTGRSESDKDSTK